MAFVLVLVILSHSFQKNAKSASPPSIPVVTAVARIGNQPIYLIGLGTVTPFETVTVRSRVDGQLMSVGVKEELQSNPRRFLCISRLTGIAEES
jgi:multidrug efflux pump subunit AcrA (membrane-fusion protein)